MIILLLASMWWLTVKCLLKYLIAGVAQCKNVTKSCRIVEFSTSLITCSVYRLICHHFFFQIPTWFSYCIGLNSLVVQFRSFWIIFGQSLNIRVVRNIFSLQENKSLNENNKINNFLYLILDFMKLHRQPFLSQILGVCFMQLEPYLI